MVLCCAMLYCISSVVCGRYGGFVIWFVVLDGVICDVQIRYALVMPDGIQYEVARHFVLVFVFGPVHGSEGDEIGYL